MRKLLPSKKIKAAKPTPIDVSESLIGKGSRFVGDFACVGMLRIEGECAGNISVAGSLVIAHGARVEAEIDADDVIIAGTARGKITARHSVTLASTATVRADIRSRTFTLEDGGLYSGSVSRMPDGIDPTVPQY